jgi:hypothetical protein
LVQVGVTLEVITVVPDWLNVLNVIAPAVTLHVPTTVPEAVIVVEAVEAMAAKLLFAVDKSNAELISNNFFNLFIFLYIGCLRNLS